MNKKIFALVLTALMALTSVVPAMAQGTVEVTGGNLSVVASEISMTTVILDGSDQITSGTTAPWAAKDLRGTGEGWHVLIAATDFTGGDQPIAVTGFEVTLSHDGIVLVPGNGNTKPISLLTEPTELGAAQKLTSAVIGDGMGSYTIQPTFTLAVPASTYAGLYSSTVTVTTATGP